MNDDSRVPEPGEDFLVVPCTVELGRTYCDVSFPEVRGVATCVSSQLGGRISVCLSYVYEGSIREHWAELNQLAYWASDEPKD